MIPVCLLFGGVLQTLLQLISVRVLRSEPTSTSAMSHWWPIFVRTRRSGRRIVYNTHQRHHWTAETSHWLHGVRIRVQVLWQQPKEDLCGCWVLCYTWSHCQANRRIWWAAAVSGMSTWVCVCAFEYHTNQYITTKGVYKYNALLVAIFKQMVCGWNSNGWFAFVEIVFLQLPVHQLHEELRTFH